VNVSGAVCLPAAQAATVGEPVRAALGRAIAADVVVVAAAGNIGGGGCAAGDGPPQVSLPGWYGDDVLAVAAVGPDDRPATFTVPGPWVDVAAPGTDVRSPTAGTTLTGTSFAAPYVAGLAALVRERYPDLTAHEVADRITATARRPPGGRNDAVGHGALDPVAALTAEPAPVRGVETGPDAVVPLPRKAPDPEPRGWPLAALALLLAAAGAAALRLRPEPPDLPAGAQPDHAECAVLSPRRPGSDPPPPHRASAPWEAVAARPREPARRA
jgi:membrane-anchored mycosin MYCP